MSTHSFYQQINQQLEQTRQDGLFKMSASSLLHNVLRLPLLTEAMLLISVLIIISV